MKIRCRSVAAAVAVTIAAGLGALVSAGPALAQGAAPGAPGANATWNEANLQGFADSLGSDLQGLVHARRWRAGERLLPGDRHPGHLRAAVHRHQRLVVRRHRNRRHHARDLPGGPDLAGLAAGEHRDQRRLHDHQDLHRRPVPIGRADPDHVRQPDRPRRCSCTPTTCRSSTTTAWATPAARTPPAATWWPPTARWSSALAVVGRLHPDDHRLRRHAPATAASSSTDSYGADLYLLHGIDRRARRPGRADPGGRQRVHHVHAGARLRLQPSRRRSRTRPRPWRPGSRRWRAHSRPAGTPGSPG